MNSFGRHIRELVLSDQYLIGEHATERLDERGILEWQVIAGMDGALLISEDADAQPNPTAAFALQLPDGIQVKAVWSWLRNLDVAKLVTIHYFDRD